jgi:2-haloacid dehalogenase
MERCLTGQSPDWTASTFGGRGRDPHSAGDAGALVLSADDVHAYKPPAGVYLYAAQRLGRPARQLRLVSGNAFDIVGAGAAGVRTAWVNRVGAPFDTIGKSPEIIVSDLGRLPDALAG